MVFKNAGAVGDPPFKKAWDVHKGARDAAENRRASPVVRAFQNFEKNRVRDCPRVQIVGVNCYDESGVVFAPGNVLVS